jgi:hypothetical protein
MSHAHAASPDARHAFLEEMACLIGNAPWWLISVSLHLVVLLAAGLVFVERIVAIDVITTGGIEREPRSYISPVTPPVEPIDRHFPSSTDDTPGMDSKDRTFGGGNLSPEKHGGGTPEGFDDGDGLSIPPVLTDFQDPPDRLKNRAMGPIGPGSSPNRPGRGNAFVNRRPHFGPGGPGNGPGDGPGDWVGIGDGPPGPHGRPSDAVLQGLRWLARHQNEDGSWDADGFAGHCGKIIRGTCGGPGYPDYDTGLTGLSLLAFLGAGYTHLARDTFDGVCFGNVVKKGVKWLVSMQDSDGCVGGRSSPKCMYNHAIATLALCEAYGMTESPVLLEPARKAVDFLVEAQNPRKGWRYTARSGDNDTSVTGWCVMALKSAELSSIPVPRAAYEGARTWLDEVTSEDGRVGYNAKGTGQVVVEGKNGHYADHDALAAIAVMSRIFIDRNRADPRLRAGAELLVRDLPARSEERV